MNRLSISGMSAIALLVVGGIVTVSSASESVPTKLAAEAKITMAQARTAALKVYPGKIMDAELERERGGSGLRYSFDIKKGKQWREIGIDAKNGHLLENSKESPYPKD